MDHGLYRSIYVTNNHRKTESLISLYVHLTTQGEDLQYRHRPSFNLEESC